MQLENSTLDTRDMKKSKNSVEINQTNWNQKATNMKMFETSENLL